MVGDIYEELSMICVKKDNEVKMKEHELKVKESCLQDILKENEVLEHKLKLTKERLQIKEKRLNETFREIETWEGKLKMTEKLVELKDIRINEALQELEDMKIKNEKLTKECISLKDSLDYIRYCDIQNEKTIETLDNRIIDLEMEIQLQKFMNETTGNETY